MTNVSRNNPTAEAIFAAFLGAQVARVKAQDENLSLRHMLYAALASACVTSIGLSSGELEWMRGLVCLGTSTSGGFLPLNSMGSVYYDPPETVTEGEYSDLEERAGTE